MDQLFSEEKYKYVSIGKTVPVNRKKIPLEQ
jgi:hypothetical protein